MVSHNSSKIKSSISAHPFGYAFEVAVRMVGLNHRASCRRLHEVKARERRRPNLAYAVSESARLYPDHDEQAAEPPATRLFLPAFHFA